MPNDSLLRILDKGVQHWNWWREENATTTLDLSNADFSGRDLRSVDFSRTDLAHANLRGADLRFADFELANLRYTDFRGAKLAAAEFGEAVALGAIFAGADLRGAKFLRAEVDAANFEAADLRAAKLKKLRAGKAHFARARLAGADVTAAHFSDAILETAEVGNVNWQEARSIPEGLLERAAVSRKTGCLAQLGIGALLTMLFAATAAAEHWTRHIVAEGYPNQTAIAADFTGDGQPDVIAFGGRKARLYVAPEWSEHILHERERGNAIHSAVMDVDQDGDLDYIGAVYSPGPVFWLERPADPLHDKWTFRLVDDKVNGTHGLHVEDIDGDGTADLIGNSAQPKDDFPESLVWWRIPAAPKSAPEWERHVFADRDAPGLSHYLGAGDLNADGHMDIASAGKDVPEGNWFAWWEQPADGSEPWKKHLIATGEIGATNIHAAHLNGDQHLDLFATRGHGTGVLWFEGPDFHKHEVDSELVGPHDLALGDIDLDGDTDAVTCAKDSKIAAWFENDGHGQFTKHEIYNDQAAYDIRLHDMDGDGDLDTLIAGQASQNVVWYENPTR